MNDAMDQAMGVSVGEAMIDHVYLYPKPNPKPNPSYLRASY